MCIYCQNFDAQLVVRILDIFFAEGRPIIFQMALALFQSLESLFFEGVSLVEEIKDKSSDDIIVLIQHGRLEPSQNSTWYTKLTPDQLIHNALKFKVTESDLEKLRKEYLHTFLFKKDLKHCIVCFTRNYGYSAGRQCCRRNC